MEETPTVAGHVFAVLLAYGISLPMLVYPIWSVVMARRARRWPRAPGEVLECATQHDEGTTVGVRYRYVVDGKWRTGTRVRFGGPIVCYRERSVAKLVARYQPGATIAVAYDPGKPQRSTLETTLDWFDILLLFLFGLAMAIPWTLHLGGLL